MRAAYVFNLVSLVCAAAAVIPHVLHIGWEWQWWTAGLLCYFAGATRQKAVDLRREECR